MTATFRNYSTYEVASNKAASWHQHSLVSSLLLKYAFGISSEGVYLRIRSDDKLFNLSLEVDFVKEFTYLGSIITENFSHDSESSKRIRKAATTMGRLANRVWKNIKLTVSTKMAVYNACVVSTLLYRSET